MLAFSKQQMQQLHEAGFADETPFSAFVLRVIRKHCRDMVRDIDDTSLREMVANGIARARSHGLNAPKDVTAFVALMFEIGPNFDEQVDIGAALRDTAVPIAERFNAMLEQVPEVAWTQAECNRRSLAWFPELDNPSHGE